MAKPQVSSQDPAISYELGLKLRDLEESHQLMKERVLLIGRNMIEQQEKNILELTELKKNIYDIKSDIKRIKDIIESLTEEIGKSARKEDLAIISRQIKLFEPLNYARIEDIEKIIEEKMHKSEIHAHENKESKPAGHNFWSGKL